MQQDINLFHNELDSYQSPLILDIYDMFIQEVDVLFETDSGEVLNSGGDNAWANLQKLIFTTGISGSTLKNRLRTLIEDECPSVEDITKWEIDIKFMHGNQSDIGIIDIIIYDERDFITKTKKYFIG